MPKIKLLALLFPIVLILFLIPVISNNLKLFLEKQSLKPPKPYKTLAEVKGISAVNLSSESGKIKYPHDVTIVLVGDSMTDKLGNADELKGYLNEYFPNKAFEVLNYGFSSTNILSVEKRLNEEVFYFRSYRPILQIDFDLILIESMGHNPLSEYPLEEGLKVQTQALERIVAVIKTNQPRAKIVFVATLGAHKRYYALNENELSEEKRENWAKERSAYIQNHIDFAKSHTIPIINIFDKSKDSNGDVKLFYIDQADYIHPSPKGVLFISKEIAKYLAENHLIE